MNISMAQVREALRKDDFEYNNSQIRRLMEAAKAAVYTDTGYDPHRCYIPEENGAKFEILSDSYIIEYVRAYIDQVDNDKILNTLAVQMEGLFKPYPAVP